MSEGTTYNSYAASISVYLCGNCSASFIRAKTVGALSPGDAARKLINGLDGAELKTATKIDQKELSRKVMYATYVPSMTVASKPYYIAHLVIKVKLDERERKVQDALGTTPVWCVKVIVSL
jgi:hypothetical protein